MNLKNQRPVFVPYEFQAEMEKLSKAALMDMVWDYAVQIAATGDVDDALAEFRNRCEIVMSHRRNAKSSA